jgi:hypothetical protein
MRKVLALNIKREGRPQGRPYSGEVGMHAHRRGRLAGRFGNRESGLMNKVLAFVAGLGAMLALAIPAQADQVYHSQQIPLNPVGAAPLRNGFVENIHANGPIVFAHEEYHLSGAMANTTYHVQLLLFPFNSTCSGSPIPIQSATFTTDAAGNGNADHVFAPADANGLHNSTDSAIWQFLSNGVVQYQSACSVIVLD